MPPGKVRILSAPKLSPIQQMETESHCLRTKNSKGYLNASTCKFHILCMKSKIVVIVQLCTYLCSADCLAGILSEVRKSYRYCARILSRFEPWQGKTCCLLGQDTLLLQWSHPPTCVNRYIGGSNAGR